MAQESVKKHKVIKDKLNNRVRVNKLIGRERGEKLMKGEVIEVTKSELDILIINNWVKLDKGEE